MTQAAQVEQKASSAASSTTSTSASSAEHPTSSGDGSGRKRKLSEASSSPWNDTILLLVGPNEHKMILHASKLRQIPFFRSCLASSMREAEERVIRLPEDQPDAMAAFIHWIYCERFERDIGDEARQKSLAESDDKSKIELQWSLMIEVYALARKYMVDRMQNNVVDSCRTALDRIRPPAEALRALVELTEGGDELRHMFMMRSAGYISYQGWMNMKAAKHEYYQDFALLKREYTEFVPEP